MKKSKKFKAQRNLSRYKSMKNKKTRLKTNSQKKLSQIQTKVYSALTKRKRKEVFAQAARMKESRFC
jgi:hypothetical protein